MRLFLSLLASLWLGRTAVATDWTGLQSIGAVSSIAPTPGGLRLRCGDGSEVQLTVLVSDLIRVRAPVIQLH